MRAPLETLLLLLSLLHLGASHRPLWPNVPKQYPIPKQDEGPLFLTPYITSGDVEVGRSLALIKDPLPDISSSDLREQYSGYITVDEAYSANTFFWFVTATEVDPAEAPVVVWLQGGPGSSSLFGFFEIHGPIRTEFDENQNTIGTINEHAWSKVANMLYIDNPVGTGYSFVDDAGLRTNIDQVGDDLYEFLTQFFTLFDNFQSNDFYIFGESYAGKFVPEIARRVDEANKQPNVDLYINLQGAGIGDGFMSPPDTAVHAEYLYQLSLVDANQRDALLDIEDDIKDAVNSGNLEDAYRLWRREQTSYMNYMGCEYVYDFTQCYYDPGEDDYAEYVQTRQAIHVGSIPFGIQGGDVFGAMTGDFMAYGQDNVEYLLNNIRTLIYDGNWDIICDHSGILKMFEKMETWEDIDAYYNTNRRVVEVNGETAGYLKSVGNLRMYVMRNAGHMVPRSQPVNALAMFTDFINGNLN